MRRDMVMRPLVSVSHSNSRVCNSHMFTPTSSPTGVYWTSADVTNFKFIETRNLSEDAHYYSWKVYTRMNHLSSTRWVGSIALEDHVTVYGVTWSPVSSDEMHCGISSSISIFVRVQEKTVTVQRLSQYVRSMTCTWISISDVSSWFMHSWSIQLRARNGTHDDRLSEDISWLLILCQKWKNLVFDIHVLVIALQQIVHGPRCKTRTRTRYQVCALWNYRQSVIRIISVRCLALTRLI
jgi:hypothetical protein